MTFGIGYFQKIKPCIDLMGHSFHAHQVPAAGCGYTVIYCIRCGRRREDLA